MSTGEPRPGVVEGTNNRDASETGSMEELTVSPEGARRRSASTPSEGPGGRFFGHPRGLLTLAGLQMWERFSFYGLLVVLAYYLYYSLTDGGLGLATPVAVAITGSYGGAVYAVQMLGAWIADRLVPARTVALCGGLLIMCGHIMLALVPGTAGLVAGLILIMVGTGGLAVNATAMVGNLYSKNDLRRDSGYSIYYMGITVGAFLGPLVTGGLQVEAGFHVAFGAAAVGMTIGIVQYIFGWKSLPSATKEIPNPLPKSKRLPALAIALLVLATIGLAVAACLITLENVSSIITAFIIVASVAYFAVILSSRSIDGKERRQVIAYIPIFLGTLLFWALLLQLATTMAVYMDTRVDLSLGTFTIPPAWIITSSSIFVAILAPVFAVVWARLGSRQPGAYTKIAIGIVVLGIGYAVFATGSGTEGSANSALIALLGMFIFAVGEIIVAPVAISTTTRLAPLAYKNQMMALYFLTMAGGSTLAGFLGAKYSPAQELLFFGGTAVAAVVIAVALILAGKIVGRSIRTN
ncbi:oligopeptide:H+ symporter [Saxibacter everestensis]|uniref:Oligopeptide:H+ symporter n=1 Tax=Saxibacter everestensis TaxID=2909229 RepID=A0ABY8QYP9_9MICO|nr:oligopeptide:H+ symporter [Brevibacteriaceae bacterium ZFBP1038]